MERKIDQASSRKLLAGIVTGIVAGIVAGIKFTELKRVHWKA
jgi:hypothetical protein